MGESAPGSNPSANEGEAGQLDASGARPEQRSWRDRLIRTCSSADGSCRPKRQPGIDPCCSCPAAKASAEASESVEVRRWGGVDSCRPSLPPPGVDAHHSSLTSPSSPCRTRTTSSPASPPSLTLSGAGCHGVRTGGSGSSWGAREGETSRIGDGANESGSGLHRSLAAAVSGRLLHTWCPRTVDL